MDERSTARHPVLDAAVHALREGRAAAALVGLEQLLVAPPDAEVAMLAAGLAAPTLARLGRLDEAAARAGQAVAAARQAGVTEAIAHYEVLADRVERARELAVEGALDAAFDTAGEALTRGDADAAIATLEPLAEVALLVGAADVEASACGMLAQALIMGGRADDARAPIARAVAIADALGDAGAKAHFEALAASIADHSASHAVGAARLTEELRTVTDAARAMLADDRPAEAAEALRGAAERAREAGLPAAEATARGLLAQALLNTQSRPEALVAASRALELATLLGDDEAIDGFTQLVSLASGFTPPVGEA